MAEVVQETQQEFWRPAVAPVIPETVPAPVPTPTASTLADACTHCGAEFMIGSRFCHACGHNRPEVHPAVNSDAAAIVRVWNQQVAWMKSVAGRLSWPKVLAPSWLHYLQFHEIKEWIGLPTASLIAFFVGLGCVVAALGVGLMTARTFVDWQAIQFYRAEWLIAATAAFVAGILLKGSNKSDKKDE
jgi:hypothetical protein